MSRWKIFGIDNKVHLLQLLITCFVFFLVRWSSHTFGRVGNVRKRAQEYFAAQYNGAPPRLFELFEYFGYGSTGAQSIRSVDDAMCCVRTAGNSFCTPQWWRAAMMMVITWAQEFGNSFLFSPRRPENGTSRIMADCFLKTLARINWLKKVFPVRWENTRR